jgi:hypothetical protein
MLPTPATIASYDFTMSAFGLPNSKYQIARGLRGRINVYSGCSGRGRRPSLAPQRATEEDAERLVIGLNDKTQKRKPEQP